MPDTPHHHMPSLGDTLPLVPPLFQSSVYTIPDLDALERIMKDGKPGFIYARDAHPNAHYLAQRLAEIESGNWGIITGSGMAAISAVLLANLQQGQRVVASKQLYGRTLQLLSQEMKRFGIITDYVDATDLDKVDKALTRGARVLLVETMSNPLLRVVDIKALAKLTKRHDCLLVVDNTFATPILVRPIELGADVAMESLTKMIGGHSDVTLGALCGKDKAQRTLIESAVSIWGFSSNPFDCWLAERGLATLEVRMRTASANAQMLAGWLSEQKNVSRVLYPGRPDHPDHDLASDQFDEVFGNMLCFELSKGREAVNRFLRAAPGIPFSPSLGHATTTLSHPASTSHRYVDAEEKKTQGISDGLIRLSVGVEDVEAIKAEMQKGLKGTGR